MILNILKKIKNVIRFNLLKKNYKKEEFEEKQDKKFQELGFNRKDGLIELNQIRNQNNFLNRNMSSEHEVLFSAISKKNQKEIKNILEIGTYDAVNSFLLATLFENANVHTIDLPDTDQKFKQTYNRSNNVNEFISKRNEIISKKKNIKFKKINSIHLTNYKEKFDLIWIDGAHGYPMVSIDIVNSLKLLNKNGIIMCDDVFMFKPSEQDSIYKSIATYETLEVLKNQNIISLKFIYKRLDALNNCDPKIRKFVSFVKKND